MAVLPRQELEAMTVVKLRELAQAQYPALQGVSGMKKEALVAALIAHEVEQGLRPKEDMAAPKPVVGAMAALKAQIRGLKAERAKAIGVRDRVGLQAARSHMKRIKRKMRRLKEAS